MNGSSLPIFMVPVPLAGIAVAGTGVIRAAPVLLLVTAATVCAVGDARLGGPGLPVMAAVAVAALVSSIAGFAFSAVCGALLFHLWDDPVRVVQLILVCSIANQVMMVWALRRGILVRTLGLFLIGGAGGLPAGVWLLMHADHALYTRAIGTFLLAYGAWMLAGTPRAVASRRPALDLLAGFLGGVTGGAAGLPSAPVTMWCGLQGWDKARQRAAVQPFILLMQVAALVLTAALGPHGGDAVPFDPASLLCLPAGLLGTSAGLAFFRRMSNRQFAVVLNVLLIVSGLSYLA